MKSFLILLLFFSLNGYTSSQYFNSHSESEGLKFEDNNSTLEENEKMNYDRGPGPPGDDVPIDESVLLLVFIAIGLGIYFHFGKVKDPL